MACLREYGREVPADVQVTGLGDSDIAQVMTPTLTTLHYHFRTSGAEAAKMLLDAMGKAEDRAQRVCMSYEIFSRNSTRRKA